MSEMTLQQALELAIQHHQSGRLNEAEGLIVTDAEQQFYVLDPKDGSMRLRDPLASDAALYQSSD